MKKIIKKVFDNIKDISKTILLVIIFVTLFVAIVISITLRVFNNQKYDSLYLNISTFDNYKDVNEKQVYLGYINYAHPTSYVIRDMSQQLIPINVDINLIDDKIKIKIECDNCNIYTYENNDLINEGSSITMVPGKTILFENTAIDNSVSNMITVSAVKGKKCIKSEIISLTSMEEIGLILLKE